MKNTFLFEVASDLYDKFGENGELYKITILTPSKRCKIFMNRYFSNLSGGKAIWSPEYKNITDLFTETSDLNLCENQIQKITLIWNLWGIYKKKVRDESFDEFFAFGEILLDDFDEIDREMIDAKKIFRNVSELSELSKPNYLNEEQIEIVKKFFNFKYEKSSELQRRFFEIWNKLYEIYTEFNGKLESEKIAYEGMLMRKAAQNFENADFSKKFTQEKYVFVGFDVFSKVEIELINHLKKHNKTLFYWDCDKYYLENAACENIRKYIKHFGSEFNKHPDNFVQKKDISFVKCVNGVSQTGYVEKWLEKIKNFTDTNSAIVLCDENLLPALLSSIPSKINVNIEITYPLRQTQIANLLVLFMDLQTKGVRVGDENNKFFGFTDKTIFSPAKNSVELLRYLQIVTKKIADAKAFENQLELSSFLEIDKMLSKMKKIAKIVEDKTVFVKIMKKIFFSMKISDYGKPAQGIQIISMPYASNMDFENLLLLSANDECLPKIRTEDSFIPQFLRKIFGMRTTETQNRREYYNFYRLLQRAQKISLSYFTSKSGAGKGEMSRFLLQLLWDSPHKEQIKEFFCEGVMQNVSEENGIVCVEKTNEIINKLKEKYAGAKKPLSPSALNNYIDCPLQFYFKYLAEIKKPDDDNELNAAVLGKIFHKTMENIYLKENNITAKFLDNYLQNNEITQETKNRIIEAFESQYFGAHTPLEEYDGEQLIFFRVVSKMVENTLIYDKSTTPFEILGLEKEYLLELEIGGERILAGGIIDRIDKKDDTIRIVDYKTGRAADPKNDYSKTLEEIFDENRKRKSAYLLQTFLYSSILCSESEFLGKKVQPLLVFALTADNDNYSPCLSVEENEIDDFNEYKSEFDALLRAKIRELFDINTPFYRREKDDYCQICDYCEICGRKVRL